MNNHDKALITFKALQDRREYERVQLVEETTNHALEVAQQATKKRRELVNYDMGKANKIRRRKR